MDPITWTYRFIFSADKEESLTLHIDPEELRLVDEPEVDLPEWTNLDVHKCEHCPLSSDEHPRCPLAVALVKPISIFVDVLSYSTLTLEAVSQQRTIRQEVPAQNAVSSLMGLVMATSGCPHTVYFRPMARFHLPLSSQEETLYRAASMYMLAQYFRNADGKEADLSLDGLSDIYQAMEKLNLAMANRVREAIQADAAVNAVVVLDFFAKNWAFSVEDHLGNIKPYFQHFLTDGASDE